MNFEVLGKKMKTTKDQFVFSSPLSIENKGCRREKLIWELNNWQTTWSLIMGSGFLDIEHVAWADFLTMNGVYLRKAGKTIVARNVANQIKMFLN